MTAYAFTVPILPGQEDADRHFIAEIQGARRAEYEATWRRLGVRAERIWHHAPRQRPEHTFDLARWRRDARRAAPPDDGGDYARPHPAAE